MKCFARKRASSWACTIWTACLQAPSALGMLSAGAQSATMACVLPRRQTLEMPVSSTPIVPSASSVTIRRKLVNPRSRLGNRATLTLSVLSDIRAQLTPREVANDVHKIFQLLMDLESTRWWGLRCVPVSTSRIFKMGRRPIACQRHSPSPRQVSAWNQVATVFTKPILI